MIKDVLLPDERVANIEGQIRKEFPRLPEGCQFATYIQYPYEAEVHGVWRVIPECAVFVIETPNPRRPILPKAHRGTWPLDKFQAMERSFSRLVDYPDPALVAFRQVAPQAINWYETMRDITDPVEGDWSGEAGQLYSSN